MQPIKKEANLLCINENTFKLPYQLKRSSPRLVVTENGDALFRTVTQQHRFTAHTRRKLRHVAFSAEQDTNARFITLPARGSRGQRWGKGRNWIGREKSREPAVSADEHDTMRHSRRESKATELSEQTVIYQFDTRKSSVKKKQQQGDSYKNFRGIF
jgi:hypothetical protein